MFQVGWHYPISKAKAGEIVVVARSAKYITFLSNYSGESKIYRKMIKHFETSECITLDTKHSEVRYLCIAD